MPKPGFGPAQVIPFHDEKTALQQAKGCDHSRKFEESIKIRKNITDFFLALSNECKMLSKQYRRALET